MAESLVAAIEEAQRAAEALRCALSAGIDVLEVARRAAVAGAPDRQVVLEMLARGDRDKRIRIADAIQTYEHAVMEMRSHGVRSLVDDGAEPLTLSDVGDLMGVSRQMIARLYRDRNEKYE